MGIAAMYHGDIVKLHGLMACSLEGYRLTIIEAHIITYIRQGDVFTAAMMLSEYLHLPMAITQHHNEAKLSIILQKLQGSQPDIDIKLLNILRDYDI